MALIPYILGVAGVAVISFLVVLINSWIGFELQSFTLLFVIPIAAIFIGAGSSFGLFGGRIITNTKVRGSDYLIAMILGFLTFTSINYLSYKTTYLQKNQDDSIAVIFQMSEPENAVPVSELVGFWEYLKITSEGSTQQLTFKGAIKVGESFEVGKTATRAMLIVQLLGFVLAAPVMGLILLSEQKYCDKCKRYFEHKKYNEFEIDAYDSIADGINSNLSNGHGLRKVLETIAVRDTKANKYGSIHLLYCPVCGNGYLQIKFFVADSDNQAKEVDDARQEIAINSSVVQVAISDRA